MDKITNSKLQ